MLPAIFYVKEMKSMKKSSVFIDESGDYGAYESHSPYYNLYKKFE